MIAAPPPEKGSLPIVKSYDGTGDSEEHIRYFNKLAMTFTLNDGMQCKLFATNLSGVANTWFDSLDPGSVPNFEVLADKFLNKYSGIRNRRETVHDLQAVVQRDGERLSDFLKRFNHVVL